MILLVVDAQSAIVNRRLYQFDLFVSCVAALIRRARESSVEVIFVRHDDGAGATLTKGQPGFEIFEGFQPTADEMIFDKKVNSAFRETGLVEYLRQKGQDTIVVVGLQTDYCMDATIKAGFEHGFRMIVPAHANSAFDHPLMSAEQTYRYYNEFMWNKRYAECIPFEDALALLTRSAPEC